MHTTACVMCLCIVRLRYDDYASQMIQIAALIPLKPGAVSRLMRGSR